jgi:hypothetical protein
MPLKLIGDGYDLLPVTVPAYGIWPKVELEVRPVSEPELEEYREQIARASNPEERFTAMVDLLCTKGHLQGWDVVGADGKVRPVNAETVRKVPGAVLRRIFDAVTGHSAEATLRELQKNSAGG